MLERLGNVLYWTGCIIAALFAALAFFLAANTNDRALGFIIPAICALVVWAIGRACRYILSGA